VPVGFVDDLDRSQKALGSRDRVSERKILGISFPTTIIVATSSPAQANGYDGDELSVDPT
jgi:hypothetical protein